MCFLSCFFKLGLWVLLYCWLSEHEENNTSGAPAHGLCVKK